MILMLTESTLHFMTLTWSLRGKKFSLTGKINNWRNHLEPETKSKASLVAKPESEFLVTTVSLVKDPPLSLTKPSEGDEEEEEDRDGDNNNNSINKDGGWGWGWGWRRRCRQRRWRQRYGDADDDKDNDFEEPALITNGKVKASLKSVVQIAESSDDETPEAPAPIAFNLLPFSQQADIIRFALEQAQPRRVSSTKRTIDEAELVESSEEYMSNRGEDAAEEDTDHHDMFEHVEQVLKPMCTTTKTSVMVAEKPNPPKKAKLEPVLSASSKPDLMAADMSTKHKTGAIMLEGGAWCRTFIPTVFLWAGAQPKFWSIETDKLLRALQAIFNILFPGINHNIQPRGPIIGLVNQRICSWHSNFGSTAIALVTNFLVASRDEENDDDNDSTEYEQGLATFLLENWAFLYEDPETCDADKIYRFLDVPALNTDGLQVKGMQAVIAASAAALECAFNFAAKPKVSKQNNTGSKESTAITAFSEANCGSVTSDYYESLKRRGVKYTADIIALVHKCQGAAKKLKSAPVEELKPMGKRALLCKGFCT
ncbi:hypothetical protein EV424DRAFT_1352524 [Suillus variegatus]|nr:hypothetical protein EV424DRAFT_1352524 [Suillus variegatus]